MLTMLLTAMQAGCRDTPPPPPSVDQPERFGMAMSSHNLNVMTA